MPNKYKAYISSTYKDLVDQRAAVAKAVRELGHEVVAMEDYTSTEEKPVDKCCADVRNSHIYLGIIAYRYGHVPKNFDKSITHLEYEAAGKAGIPRLLFLIGDEAPWPLSLHDDDPTKIKHFRAMLQEQHTVTILKDMDRLQSKAIASLSRKIHELEQENRPARVAGSHQYGRKIPLMLPYLSNRSKQRSALEDALYEEVGQGRDSKPVCCKDLLHCKPFAGVIHGNENECHEKFVNKLRDHLLPELLELPSRMNAIIRKDIRWPEPFGNAKKRACKLEINIAMALTGKRDTNKQNVVNALNLERAPVIVYASIHTAAWQKTEKELIASWLRYWHALPELNIGRKIFAFLCIRYQNLEGKSSRRERKYAALNAQARACIESLDFDRCENLSGLVLPELEAVELFDLDGWIERYASRHCDDEQLRVKIDQFYNEMDCDEIPMAQLAEKLRRFLEETWY